MPHHPHIAKIVFCNIIKFNSSWSNLQSFNLSSLSSSSTYRVTSHKSGAHERSLFILKLKDPRIRITQFHISLLLFMSSISLGECLILDSIVQCLALCTVFWSTATRLCKILQLDISMSKQWPTSFLSAEREKWLQQMSQNNNSPPIPTREELPIAPNSYSLLWLSLQARL